MFFFVCIVALDPTKNARERHEHGLAAHRGMGEAVVQAASQRRAFAFVKD